MSGGPERVVLDLGVATTITLGEWADIEDAAGRGMVGVDLRRPPMWVIAGMLWITRRRDDPTARYEDFANLTITQLDRRGADPTPAAESPAA